jgi:hypothetical protein
MDIQEVGWGYGLDWSGSREGKVAGFWEYCLKLSGFINFGEFLDYLRNF